MDQHIKSLIWLAAAGLSGSIVGARLTVRKRKKLTATDMAWYLICGLLTAFFFTPVVCKLFHVADVHDVRAVAFFTGAFWSKILDRYSQKVDPNQPKDEAKND
ncbi:TPA: hypothetical protein JG832_002526 [Enterobacter hormaechei subsp. xiangfangensis]|nr:hypothetical protein [Enterobacter hormaechei subsp. xiangfangensis]HAV1890661.1 hypothetical protein [Enterobacter hormaechei subsp. xiangfangensis]